MSFGSMLLHILIKKTVTLPKVMRFLSAWAILFVSKLIILEAINYAFEDHILFLGLYHGIVAFIFVVAGILLAELDCFKNI